MWIIYVSSVYKHIFTQYIHIHILDLSTLCGKVEKLMKAFIYQLFVYFRCGKLYGKLLVLSLIHTYIYCGKLIHYFSTFKSCGKLWKTHYKPMVINLWITFECGMWKTLNFFFLKCGKLLIIITLA